MSLYAWLLLATIVIPLTLSFEQRLRFYTYWKLLLPSICISALFFIIWDSWFVKKGVWGFNTEYVWSIRIYHLPIEEWLFFIVIPYSSIFIYTCLKFYILQPPFSIKQTKLITMIALITSLGGLLFYHRTYTFFNGFLAFTILVVHYKWFANKTWMSYFWLTYFIHLIPFFIINGVLTGALTIKPIVWYNEKHILGIRLYTIPIEDMVYAMVCLLLPISILEWLNYYFKIPNKH